MNFDFWNYLFGGDGNAPTHSMDTPMAAINPSTGLSMMDGGMGGVDVGGSPFGTDTRSSISDNFMGSAGANPWD